MKERHYKAKGSWLHKCNLFLKKYFVLVCWNLHFNANRYCTQLYVHHFANHASHCLNNPERNMTQNSTNLLWQDYDWHRMLCTWQFCQCRHREELPPLLGCRFQSDRVRYSCQRRTVGKSTLLSAHDLCVMRVSWPIWSDSCLGHIRLVRNNFPLE